MRSYWTQTSSHKNEASFLFHFHSARRRLSLISQGQSGAKIFSGNIKNSEVQGSLKQIKCGPGLYFPMKIIKNSGVWGHLECILFWDNISHSLFNHKNEILNAEYIPQVYRGRFGRKHRFHRVTYF